MASSSTLVNACGSKKGEGVVSGRYNVGFQRHI